MSAPRRWALIALAALGLGLVAAPAVFRMFERAPKGADMIAGFAPYMKDARLAGYQRHIADIDAAVREADAKVAPALAGAGAARFDARFPTFAGFREEWGPIHDDMGEMLATIRANVGNYDAVAALPSFTLFPWFFVIPGVLVALLAGLALVRPAAWPRLRWGLVALGAGLILAPAVFQMFTRAPKGATMVGAFTTVETRKKVETIQGYFGSIAVGQGAVRLELVPALRRSGLSDAEIARRFPASTALVTRWPAILGDLTPMIGAMSDNVGNYDAVAALPDFRLFPWFFVAPGLIALGLVGAAGRRRRDNAVLAAPSLRAERAA